PERFHVVTPLGDESYRLADFGAYYRLVRARLSDAASATPPPATYPEPVVQSTCATIGAAAGSASRHPPYGNIRTANVREFQRQGLLTVVAVAQAGGDLPCDPSRGSAETYRRLGSQARLQVEARSGGPPPVELLAPEGGRGLGRLPQPSRGDVFLD